MKAGLPGRSPEALALLPGFRSFPALPGAGSLEAALPPRPDSFQVDAPFLSQPNLRSHFPQGQAKVFPPQPMPASTSGRSQRGLGSRLSSWPPGPQRPTHPSGMNELRLAGTWPRSRPIFRAVPAHAAAEGAGWRWMDLRRGRCGDLPASPESQRERGCLNAELAPVGAGREVAPGAEWRLRVHPWRAGAGGRRGA